MMRQKWGWIVALTALVGCGSLESGHEIPGEKPFPPSELVAQTEDEKVILSWKDNSQIEESYRIERRTESEAEFIEIGTTDSDTEIFEDSTVASDESYAYRVRAANEKGFSEFSNEEIINISFGLPSAPSSLVATYNPADPADVYLSWIDNSNNETAFRVLRRDGSVIGSKPSVVETLSPNIEQFSDKGPFGEGQTYCYVIQAVNDLGTQDSNEECISTPPPTNPPH